jgi:hypothetical protein
MSGHVHGGNSTIVINGTYFVTTRTMGGAIDTSHGFRTYVVYPNCTIKIDPRPHWRCVYFCTGGRHADCVESGGHRGVCGPLWTTC